MKLILRFLKPHWKLFVITVILLILDVMGALFIPTLAAQMLNLGTSGSSFTQMWHVGVQMAVISVISGICAIIGGYTCAALAARIGKDMRSAIYKKSLKLSIYDFRQFGTASITTRTVSDVTTIQTALTSTIQMILPVPVICVVAIVLCFQLDVEMGLILLGCMVVVLLLAWGIMRSAAPLFKKLQKLLDRMSTVLLENITGVRVVRAFNNEKRERHRMTAAFSDYAQTSIKANRRFANLDGLSFFFINLFVVIVYWLCGGEIDTGNLQIGDITAVIEYALMVMFFLMLAQMVILTLASNLRYSNTNASDDALMHAVDVAQAGEFVRSLPDGLESFVAQGGTNFSGGQKQRLSIARALVKKPELYIFDDSFSALDFKTDAALRKALARETQDAAVLIIAQRVSTIRHAQQIVVLHEGGMAGIGTHEELLENCPVYREIYESQTKEAQEA